MGADIVADKASKHKWEGFRTRRVVNARELALVPAEAAINADTTSKQTCPADVKF